MQKTNFTIHGQVRGGKNSMQINPRTGAHYPNYVFKKWSKPVIEDLKFYLAQINHKTITEPCSMRVKYWSEDLRRRDVPAMMDALFHCFEKAGLTIDDFLIQDVDWRYMGHEKNNPRVDVEIILKENKNET